MDGILAGGAKGGQSGLFLMIQYQRAGVANTSRLMITFTTEGTEWLTNSDMNVDRGKKCVIRFRLTLPLKGD